MEVPRCMSTQHPDNVLTPFFADRSVMQGDAEVREAYYAYSHLGCTEQMWDCEGKEVDAFVVKKLLSRYESFFRQRRLGEDLFLTLRVPNPRVERTEAKVLLETLESIPRSCDAARLFYGEEDPPPVFEVILPMTADSCEINRVYHYYRSSIGARENQRCFDRSVKEWLGCFHPRVIHVIPLIEEREPLLATDRIVGEYLQEKDIPWQRVFLARSDPALNYGQISAVLLTKIALQRLWRLERRLGRPLYPILGTGSSPFRGNLRPGRVVDVLVEFPSVQTFTIQSAFKYDSPEEEARKGVSKLNQSHRSAATEVDEARLIRIIDRVSERYSECVAALAPIVNKLARHVPPRRARKLHIGLFGYSRQLEGSSGVRLPRAIGFCASLYSLGLPPEVLGMGALGKDELRAVRAAYRNVDLDMSDALRYLNEGNVRRLPPVIREEVRAALDMFACEIDEDHAELSHRILEAASSDRGIAEAGELIVRAGSLRGFLG